MPIGLDLDNTLIHYDPLFIETAVEWGLIDATHPCGMPWNKKSVRGHTRALKNGETRWRELQAEIYGRRIAQAPLMPGADQFLKRCKTEQISLVIISHKTQYAAADPGGIDLRKAAMGWLKQRGFFDADIYGMTPDRVFFESTREAKIARIKTEGCHKYVDDLVEVLSDPTFPSDCSRYLITPVTSLFEPEHGVTAPPAILPNSICAAGGWSLLEENIFMER